MRTRSLSLLAGIALAAFTALWGALHLAGSTPRAVGEHPVSIPATARTVTISSTMPAPSESPRRLSAMLVEGTLPTGSTTAEVLTDTECTPDAAMISRCRNELRLPDGTTIVVRHPHDMRHVPCLAPGERVRLVSASA